MTDPIRTIRVGDRGDARQRLTEPVMTWARDSETGRPRYILELDAAHTGASCGCECHSCGAKLTAVNAAKSEWIKRPHFRHPDGTERGDCQIVSARAAALRALEDHGEIDLPCHRVGARISGLGGAFYDGTAIAPPERVRISSVNFSDRAYAVLNLDDGRRLYVRLTGGTSGMADPLDPTGRPLPSIDIELTDAAIASMSPDEIWNRLSLLPDAFCWRQHWNDAALMAQATRNAQEVADDHLDWPPEGIAIPEDLPPGLRRETLLHIEAKRVLQETGHLWLPGLESVIEVSDPGIEKQQRFYCVEPRQVTVSDARLETRIGRLIPDVMCTASVDSTVLFDPLCIEVTVTNHMTAERLARICGQGAATLEIDLSITGGRITREQFRKLIVDEIAAKKWLFYPGLESIRVNLMLDLQELGLAQKRKREGIDSGTRRVEPASQGNASLARVCEEYLAAVEESLAPESFDPPIPYTSRFHTAAVQRRLAAAVQSLERHGFPEAHDDRLKGHHGILARLLSIKHDCGIGYKYATAAEVLNAIQQSSGSRRSEWSLYLIAVRTYATPINEALSRWYKPWVEEVRRGVRDQDPSFLRDPIYDRLLSLLLPEMAIALAKPKGKRSLSQNELHGSRPRLSSPPPAVDPRTLRGKALYDWKKDNPEAAWVFGYVKKRPTS